MIKHFSVSSSSSTPLPGKFWFILGLLIASIVPIQIVPSAERPRPGADGQYSGKQGEVLWVEVPVADPHAKVHGILLKRTIPFFPLSDSRFGAIVGIDMEDPPGLQELQIRIQTPHQTDQMSYTLLIMKEEYPVQQLTLPNNQVDLDSKTLQRVRREQREMTEAFQHIASQPLWDGPFVAPLHGKITGRFGSRRVINGQPRRPHSGEDIAAPTGTPVRAMNTGTVAATMDHFFSGKGVILNHGVGLFSMYFHLSEIGVKPGQFLQKGEALGKVGSTGRATGPHLHWGIRLHGARVNPYALTALPMHHSS